MNPIVKAFLCGVYEIGHPLSVFRGNFLVITECVKKSDTISITVISLIEAAAYIGNPKFNFVDEAFI